MLRTAIEQFGHRLGMDALSMSQQGIIALDVSGVGRLYLEISKNSGQEELLVYIIRPVTVYDQDLARRALAFCHYAHAHPWPVHAGVHKDNLLILVRLSERSATAQTIENAALFLANSLHSICEGNKHA